MALTKLENGWISTKKISTLINFNSAKMSPDRILTALLMLSALPLMGQEKRIDKKHVSIAIQNYINKNYPSANKIKYFKEQENASSIIECVFKLNKQEYALTFISDSLIETEISISFGDILNNLQNTIRNNLNEEFTSYKIIDCQLVNPKNGLLYEINIRTKSGRYYEFFYDNSGNLIKKKEIIIKPIPSQF